ncbi:hypothetical protein ACJMK2_036126 [Sinanodonta woodiana]|uniref:Uncharacterized protein n=2 Tax=Sinanodonta woodiana TaxID=1069815 RepID=A0ABD3WG95_SINWO
MIYRTVFIHNLQVNGRTIEDLDLEDTTTEFEPLDVEKKDYINNVLLEKVDACMVETSRKRKRCPKSVQSGLKKRIKHDFSHLLHLKIRTESMNNQEEVTVNLQSTEETSQSMAATLSKITKESEKSLARAKDVVKSLRIFSKCQRNEIGRFLYKTSPRKPCPQIRACIWRNASEINKNLKI